MKIKRWSIGRERAFTRGDLLGLVTLLLLLAALQAPLFGGSRSGNQGAVCKRNLQRLTQAWLMYADDHDGRLVPNEASTSFGLPEHTWSEGWVGFGLGSYVTNQSRLVDPALTGGRTGLLGPYLQRDATVFKCPVDRNSITIFGRRYDRIRSVAMNNWLGGAPAQPAAEFKTFNRLEGFTRPAPSEALVFIEEREDTIDDGVFTVDMTHYLIDIPAAYHDGGSHLAFADGHVGYRAWTDPRTVAPPPTRGEVIPIGVPMIGNADLEFLRSVATAPR